MAFHFIEVAYMSVYEVELTRKTQYLVDGYSRAFKEIFKKEPLITADDRSAVRDLIHKQRLKEQDIIEVVTNYLYLQDEWVAKQGYPLRLLEGKYNAILTMGKVGKRIYAEAKKFLITETLTCDSCWVRFQCDHDAQIDLQAVWIRCPLCLEINQPWKYPTKEEFEKRWQQMGKKVPGYEKIFITKDPYPERPDLVYINAK